MVSLVFFGLGALVCAFGGPGLSVACLGKPRVLLPSKWWIPGGPLGIWWGLAAAGGFFGFNLPVVDERFALVNAFCGFALAAWVASFPSRIGRSGLPAPKLGLKDLSWLNGLGAIPGGLFGGLVSAGLSRLDVLLVPVRSFLASCGFNVPPALFSGWPATLGLIVAGGLAGVCVSAAFGGWRGWRRAAAKRDEWSGRWEALRITPGPLVESVEQVGDASVTVFFVPPGGKDIKFFASCEDQIRQFFPPSATICTAPVVAEGGVSDVSRFQLIVWPNGLPTFDPASDDEQAAKVAFTSSMAVMCAQYSWWRPQLVSALKVGPALWCVEFAGGQAADKKLFRGSTSNIFASQLGTNAVSDHRTSAAGTVIYVGDWSSPDGIDASLMPSRVNGDPKEFLDHLATEDQWESWWGWALPKSLAKLAPTMAGAQKSYKIDRFSTVKVQPFAARVGQDAADLVKYAPKLASAMQLRGWLAILPVLSPPGPDGAPDKLRFNVVYCDDSMPAASSLDLMFDGPGMEYVWGAKVQAGFADARLGEGLVWRVVPTAGGLWQVWVRLVGQVSLADVKSKLAKLATSFAADYLRAAPLDGGVMFLAGPIPDREQMAALGDAGEAAGQLVASLDWDQAFADAKILGPDGTGPKMLDWAPLPNNPKVERMVFTIPATKSLEVIRANISRLRSGTGMGFIDVCPGESSDEFVVLAAANDPVPFPAPYDPSIPIEKIRLPFATGVDGSSVSVDFGRNPHLGVFGTTGGGKSVALQDFIVSAKRAGGDVAVIDVQKAGADFRFADDWLSATAYELGQAVGLLEWAYHTSKARQDLNAEHGVGHVKDLPPDIRPRPLFIFVDEFVGLISTGKRPSSSPSSDPDAEAVRLAQLAEFNAKRRIEYLIDRISAESRSAGVHLVLATQEIKSSMLDGASSLKTNLARLLLGKATNGQRMSALRDWESAPRLQDGQAPAGRGVWEPIDGRAQIVQCWFAPSDQLAEFLFDADVPFADRVDFSDFVPASNDGPFALADDEPLDGGEIVDLGTVDIDWGELAFDVPEEAGEQPEGQPQLEDEPELGSVDGFDLWGSDDDDNDGQLEALEHDSAGREPTEPTGPAESSKPLRPKRSGGGFSIF